MGPFDGGSDDAGGRADPLGANRLRKLAPPAERNNGHAGAATKLAAEFRRRGGTGGVIHITAPVVG
jgi:hypothetical protein